MPFTDPHRLVTFFGDAWNQAEIWQFSVRVASASSDAPSAGTMTTLVGAGEAFMATGLFSSQARFLGVKVAPQDVDGRYPDGQDAVEALAATPVVGLGTTGAVPQITLCVTTTTTKSRGVGSKGRFYPPCTAFFPTADGRVSPGNAEAMRGTAIALIDAVNGSGVGRVSVMSRGTENGPPSTLPVVGVRVGRVLDTQRRRRNSLTEEYVSGDVDPS